MKQLKLAVLALLCLTQAAHAQKGFTLTGHLTGIDTGHIVLKYTYGYDGVTDTAVIENGTFTFTGKVEDVMIASIHTYDHRIWNEFMLQNVPGIQLYAGSTRESFRVTGCPANDDYDNLQKVLVPLQKKQMDLYMELQKLKKTDSVLAAKRFKEELQPLYDAYPQTIRDFVNTHPSSLLSLFFLFNMESSMDANKAMAIYNGFDPALRNSERGKRLLKNIEGRKATGVGEQIIPFTLPDTNGKLVKLDNFRKGKYILVDFWASWCGPCRAENPNLLKAYKRFGGDKFQIVGVSIDKDDKQWKQAVEEDGMPWTNVCDVKGLKNKMATKYGITTVPTNFLVDPNGVIVARDLRGNALENKLAEIFGNHE